MSNKLIKKYTYIEKGETEPKQANRVLKSGTYRSVKPEHSGQNPKNSQKKKLNAPERGAQFSKIKSSLKSSKHFGSGSADSSKSAESQEQSELTAVDAMADCEALIKKEAARAYQRGLHEGKINAVAINDAKIAQASAIFDNIKIELTKASKKFFDEIEKVAMDMSVHLARKIIGDAVNAVPDVIKANVDKCLELLAGAGAVDIKINPSDYDTIKAYLPSLEQNLESRFSFKLEPDRNIEKGGCLVEFEGSVIDGRIETQFQKIKKQMEILT